MVMGMEYSREMLGSSIQGIQAEYSVGVKKRHLGKKMKS